MSCINATAPINITKNTDNICNLKCSYTFNYGTTNLRIQNNRDNISFKVDETNAAPVTYNDQTYQVKEVRLYYPSLHHYAGKNAAAELIISHTNTTSTGNLLVCVPIIVSSSSTSESLAFLDLIISEIRKTAPIYGDQTVLNLPTFSLDKFVPMKPYFSYNGTLPWKPCNGAYDYIVFNIDNAIHMSSIALSTLKQVTAEQTRTLSTINDGGLFYNANGPTPRSQGSIYIDCQPTGDDGEVLVSLKPDSGGLLDNPVVAQLLSNTLVKLGIGGVIMVCIWILSSKVITALATRGSGKAVVNTAATIKEAVDTIQKK